MKFNNVQQFSDLKKQKGAFKEIVKGVVDFSRIDNSAFDVFSSYQLSKFLKEKLEDNVGLPKEIQKSIINNIEKDFSQLIGVTGNSCGKLKEYFIAPKGVCQEILKSVTPTNEGKNATDIDVEEVLDFIKQSNPTIDDLKDKFGDGIEDTLDKLINENQISIDSDGVYNIVGSDSESEDKEPDDNDSEDNEPEDNDSEDNEPEDKEPEDNEPEDKNSDNESEEDKKSEDKPSDEKTEGLKGEEIPVDNEPEDNPSEDNESNNDSEDNEPEDNDSDNESEDNDSDDDNSEDNDSEDNDSDDNPEDDNPENNNSEDNQEDNDSEDNSEDNGSEDKDSDNDSNPNGNLFNNEQPDNEDEEGKEEKNPDDSDSYTPEELEQMAKKTASATLIKFYKNSDDDKLKEVAAIELKTRGIDVGNKDNEGGNEGNDPNLPDTKQELEKLQKWIKDYFSEFDKEDLVQYITTLALASPEKRKSLKQAYREYYSMNNAGNKILKVDENDLKDYLENHYFNNFTISDLQSYAYLLLQKNKKEYKKLKSLYEEDKEPII